MTKANNYAVLAVTEMYGPATRYEIAGWHADLAAAKAAAAAIDPDWDNGVQCHRLGYNQASPTRGMVAEEAYVNLDEYEIEEHEAAGRIVLMDDEAGWLVALEEVQ